MAEIFRMDIRSAAGPTYGWTSVSSGHEAGRTHTFQAGLGAGGRDAVDIAFTTYNAGAGTWPAADLRAGWEGVSGWPSLAQGDDLYVQIIAKYLVTGTLLNPVDSGPWGGKDVILGSRGGGGDPWRTIAIVEEPNVSPFFPQYVQKNIDGYPTSTWNDPAGYSDKLIAPAGAHYAAQWAVETGPTAAGGGVFKFWINNDSYASPTKVSGTDLALDATLLFGEPTMWGSCNPVQTGGTLTIRITRVSISTHFVTDLYATLNDGPPSAAPRSTRIALV